LVAVGAAFAVHRTVVALTVGGNGRRGEAGKEQDEHQLTHGQNLGA
jgi:hypothetical protein